MLGDQIGEETGTWVRQRFTAHAGDAGKCVALALVASLIGGPRAASSLAHLLSGPQVAEADGVDEGTQRTWFGLGELLADVARAGIPDRERERRGVDRNAEQVGTPVDFDVPSLITPDPGR
jgi:hypothetical protein